MPVLRRPNFPALADERLKPPHLIPPSVLTLAAEEAQPVFLVRGQLRAVGPVVQDTHRLEGRIDVLTELLEPPEQDGHPGRRLLAGEYRDQQVVAGRQGVDATDVN